MEYYATIPGAHVFSCKTTFSRHVAYLHVSMWCGTLCHLSFANLSNFLKIRANLNCLRIQRISTMYLDFARGTQRYVLRRHPRSRKILDFDRNYYFTLIQIVRGFTFSPLKRISSRNSHTHIHTITYICNSHLPFND